MIENVIFLTTERYKTRDLLLNKTFIQNDFAPFLLLHISSGNVDFLSTASKYRFPFGKNHVPQIFKELVTKEDFL